MADISKMKLPNGSQYDLKDDYARKNKLDKNPLLFTTNSFRGDLSTAYISKIDNAFYAANKRWTITCKDENGTAVTNLSLGSLFDGDYETNVVIPLGKTYTFTMDFTGGGSGTFPGYPYGYMFVSFYFA